MRTRWEEYRKSRLKLRLPIQGSERLFATVWKEMDNVVEISATGHAICDTCIAIGVREDTYGHRGDDVALKENATTARWKSTHKAEHRGERDYAADMQVACQLFVLTRTPAHPHLPADAAPLSSRVDYMTSAPNYMTLSIPLVRGTAS
jgi:hypothetical protein